VEWLQAELNKVMAAGAKPDRSQEVVAALQTKLESAEGRAANLESQAAAWQAHWKSAEEKAERFEEKARSFEAELAAKTRGLEAEFREKARSFEERLVAKSKQLEAAVQKNPLARRPSLIAGAILLVMGGLAGYAAGRYMINRKVSDLTNTLAATEKQQRLTEDELASAKRDLAAVENQLKVEVAKEVSIAQTAGQQAASTQRIQQLQSQITSLNNQIGYLRAHATPVIPQAGVLIWSGTLAIRTRIDITNGVPNYGTVKGALPGRPCNLSISDPHVRLMMTPTAGNHWNRVSFEISGPGKFKVYINWELAG